MAKVKTARKPSGLRLVAVYAMFMAAAFALQVFPLPGIFAMMLGSVLWIGILVHVLMAHLAMEALSRRITRAWLLIPLAYYGGGFALYLESVRRAEAVVAEIDARNATASHRPELPFRYAAKGGLGASGLLEHYRVDEELRDSSTRYYARGEDCDRASKSFYDDKRHEPFLLISDLFPQYKGADKTRQCILSQNRQPADWRYVIDGEYISRKESYLSNRSGHQWTFTDRADGTVKLTVEEATIQALMPVPMVLAGCWLDSGGSAWRCQATLMKSFFPFRTSAKDRRPGTPEIDVLARALGLERRRPSD